MNTEDDNIRKRIGELKGRRGLENKLLLETLEKDLARHCRGDKAHTIAESYLKEDAILAMLPRVSRKHPPKEW